MSAEDFKRKLTAIFSADVAGYSRLMGDDEAATVRTLEAYKQVMFSLIKQHRGRLIDSPGDNLLAEFASVVDAVQCGVAIQNELKARNEELPENRRMKFRIGVNLGDVIEEGDRIYGDGVNIAARLEALAEPGGICVSKTAFDQIETKLPLGYEYLGEQEVKNIPKPVGAYRVLMEPRVTVAGEIEEKKAVPVWRRRTILAGAVVLVAVAIAALIWNFYFRPPQIEPASEERMAFPLPDKPSIAVLPFVNMSRDQSDEYIADGLSENIISSLSKIPDMLVIARNSTFVYKGKAVKVNQVAEELGVRYVLEGSVQKSGDNMRVTAQLVDAIKGHHLWSERYDRNTKDFFAVQDDITRKIVIALQVELTEGEQARIVHATENLEAWGYATKGITLFQHYTKEKNAKARELLEKAVELDPNYAVSWIFIAWTHLLDFRYGWGASRAESLKLGIGIVQKASALDDKQPEVHSFWNTVYLFQRQYDKAIAEGKQAIALGPSDASSHILLSMALHFSGKQEEAIFHAKEAMRLSPYYPNWFLKYLAMSYCMAEEYEKAITVLEKAIERAKAEGSQIVPNYLYMVHALVGLGDIDKAKALAAEVLKLEPNFSLQNWQKSLFYKDPADLERHLAALRKAGLPETPSLPLPDKPSIAVLPFVNMSDDPGQEYFSDGITEEIITALSKTPKLFVIARNSSFTYKGKPMKVQKVGRELGVKYVLEGSVRKAENRVRVTAQLVDASSGHHIWADRYDRELKDIFALQDDITMKVITALQVELTEGERAGLWAKSTNNLEAYLKFLEGVNYTYEDKWLSEARPLFEKAISLDPQFSTAYGWLAYTYLMDVWFGPSDSRSESFKKGVDSAKKCVAIDDSEAFGHAMLGQFYLMSRRYDKALEEGNKALALSPNDSWIALWQGMTLRCVGRYEEAVSIVQRAVRLDPLNIKWPLLHLGHAYLLMRRYEDAIETYKKALNLDPNIFNAYIGLAVAYSTLDRMDEARAAASDLIKLRPKFSVMNFTNTLPYKNEADKEFFVSSLRKAGLK